MEKYRLIAIVFTSGLLSQVYGGADNEVERVSHPRVDHRDLGPLMSNSQGRQYSYGSGYSSQGSYNPQGCLSCKYHTSSSSSPGNQYGSSSLGSQYGSSYSTGRRMGSSLGNLPMQSSSSHYEKREKEEFVNGQQVYDLEHEKEYQNGQLIKEKLDEKTPKDFGISDTLGTSYGAGSNYNSPAINSPLYSPSTGRSSSSVQHQQYSSSSQSNPQVVYGNIPHTSSSSQTVAGSYSGGFDDKHLESEMERMRQEMERRTLDLHHDSLGAAPTYHGSNHRTEVRTQMKYVNGKPVYIRNEERKYRDGELIHNATKEQGPGELGNGHLIPEDKLLTKSYHESTQNKPHVYYPSNNAASYGGSNERSSHYPNSQYKSHSNNYHSYPQSKSNYPSSSVVYEGNSNGYRSVPSNDYQRATEDHRSSSSGYRSGSVKYPSLPTESTLHQNINYLPGKVYKTEVREEVERTSSTGYQPSYSQGTEYDAGNTRLYSTHRDNNYNRNPSYNTDYGQRPLSSDDSSNSHSSSSSYRTTGSHQYVPGISSGSRTYDDSVYRQRSLVPTTDRPSALTPQRGDKTSNHYLTAPRSSNYQPSNRSPTVHSYIPGIYSSRRSSQEENTHRVSSRQYTDDEDSSEDESIYRPSPPTTEQPLAPRGQDEGFSHHVNYESKYLSSPRISNYQPSDRSQTVHSYAPGIYSSRSSKEESSHRVSSRQNQNDDIEDENSYLSSDDDRKRDNHVIVPGVISGPNSDANSRSITDEEERYDINPLVDGDEDDDDRSTDFLESNPNIKRYPYTSDYAARAYEQRHSRGPQHPIGVSMTNSSSKESHYRTSVSPTNWVETTTTNTYVNGKLASKLIFYKYYENGILVDQNVTEKSRDQLANEGVDVYGLDLSQSDLLSYGPSESSSIHSQKHEVYQVKRFKSGLPIYELNEERRYQDGKLVHENKEEKNEDDFLSANRLLIESQNMNSFPSLSTSHRVTSAFNANNPPGYVKKHEVHQEEEFINGQKVYDLHHEREFHNGELIRENKKENGPKDLGVAGIDQTYRGGVASSHSSYQGHDQRQHSLKTGCLTCGTAGSSNLMAQSGSQGLLLGSFGNPHGQQKTSTFRQDFNVEEHYENGRLVKGVEDKKKWNDGILTDAKTEHYSGGPSRTSLHMPSTGKKFLTSEGGSSSAYNDRSSRASSYRADECTTNHCQNDGTCKISGRKPVCICLLGFKGSRCEEAYCPNRWCRYGGRCSITHEGKHSCDCTEGYTGDRCSARIYKIKLSSSG